MNNGEDDFTHFDNGQDSLKDVLESAKMKKKERSNIRDFLLT